MRRSLCIALLLLAASAGTAAAQSPVVEGPGIRVGEGTVIHPSVGVLTGVLSNPFYESSDPNPVPVVHLRGAFTIASQHSRPAGELALLHSDEERSDAAPALEFRFGAHVDAEWYLSGDEQTAQRLVSGGLSGHVLTAPRGPVSVFADDTLVRVSQPVNFDYAPWRNLNRIINRFAGGVQVRPGGGAFRFALQYENTIDAFESSDSSFANRIHHLARARGEWQFLPRTRFFLDGSWGYFGPLSGASCELLKRESRPLRVLGGASTALTELTSLRAHIGYGNGYYQSRGAAGCMDVGNEDFNNVLLGAELGFRYSPLGRLSVTYEYDFQDSLQANYFTDHALIARVIHQIDRVQLFSGLDLRLRHYAGIMPALSGPAGEMSRDDIIVRLFGRAHYVFRDWLAFTAELDLVSDSTDFTYNGDPLGYNRTELRIGTVAAF
ncbi:hypothetical protein [Haliangium ochraceum]|uniref:Uncharacterized protein n=1 Tax=Haliangium ochraceum (strain DSM 14365 / JCM 11303 / SMP-2) TaxID=502025 RepID=D0LIS0_HALO1|nr:hypothetical protein [Haliangium ochraceum]ACY12949.1 hypothetical protein Hoch_0308 [Haliangium ochraceum DSM 14365]